MVHSDLCRISVEDLEKLAQKEKDKCLIKFAGSNDVIFAKQVIEAGANILAKNGGGYNSLHYAAKTNNIALFNFLIEEAKNNKEIDLEEFIDDTTDEGSTALNIAAEYAATNVLDELIANQASVDSKRVDSLTPLHFLARNCLHIQIKKIIKEPLVTLNSQSSSGNTAIHFATHSNCVNGVKYLAKAGADLDIVNVDGEAAIHVAARRGYEEVAVNLLKYSANATIIDGSGNCPMHIAAKYGNANIISKILTINKLDIDILNEENKETALFIAAKNGYEEASKLLIDHGANINYVEPETEMRIADATIVGSNLKILNYLLSENPNILEITNSFGATPIHYAVGANKLDLVIHLLDKGVDVNTRDEKGLSPLHIAILNNNPVMVKKLVEKGAYPNARDMEGQTIYQYAMFIGNEKIIDILISIDEIDKSEIGLFSGFKFTTFSFGDYIKPYVCPEENLSEKELLVEVEGKKAVVADAFRQLYDHMISGFCKWKPGGDYGPFITRSDNNTIVGTSEDCKDKDIVTVVKNYGTNNIYICNEIYEQTLLAGYIEDFITAPIIRPIKSFLSPDFMRLRIV
jgi:ankyrin repeat protein